MLPSTFSSLLHSEEKEEGGAEYTTVTCSSNIPYTFTHSMWVEAYVSGQSLCITIRFFHQHSCQYSSSTFLPYILSAPFPSFPPSSFLSFPPLSSPSPPSPLSFPLLSSPSYPLPPLLPSSLLFSPLLPSPSPPLPTLIHTSPLQITKPLPQPHSHLCGTCTYVQRHME